jgi:hypothetical protein
VVLEVLQNVDGKKNFLRFRNVSKQMECDPANSPKQRGIDEKL